MKTKYITKLQWFLKSTKKRAGRKFFENRSSGADNFEKNQYES